MKSINAQCPESRKNVSRYFKSIRISRIILVGDETDAVKNKFARNKIFRIKQETFTPGAMNLFDFGINYLDTCKDPNADNND